MQLGSTETQVFYDLLDLDESQKQQYLKDLQAARPDVYQQIEPLLESEQSSAEQLTLLFGAGIQQLATPERSLEGEIISKYQVESELGRGGMGIVYAACRADKTFEQKLAIKVLQSDLAKVFDSHALFKEAQLLAGLNHPNIAKVFDGGIHNDAVYIVMERIQGQDLAQALSQNHLSQNDKLHIFRQVCLAIEHAHQHNIIHGDIKPENILLDEQNRPKLIDFNLTQKVYPSETQSIQPVAYSAFYASPEVKLGSPLSKSSDIFALGQLLSVMFPSQKIWSDIWAIRNHAIKEKPNLRYQSVKELRLDIERAQQKRPVEPKRFLPFYSTVRLFQRHPLASFLLLTLFVMGAGFSATLASKNNQLYQEKLVAENMMLEVTRLMFLAKDNNDHQISAHAMLELTRRRILSNPEIPQHIKQKVLMAMMTPAPEKKEADPNCLTRHCNFGK